MIHRWLRVADNRTEIARLGGADYLERICQETPTYMARIAQISERVFGEFINLFGIEKRFFRLPMR
jgi:hypothetical protein